MDTDGCSMYAIKVEREITETGTGEREQGWKTQ